MKFKMLFLFSILVIACSDEVEVKKESPKKAIPIQSKPVNTLKPQSSTEHISGSGESRISGAPSTTHLSGQ